MGRTIVSVAVGYLAMVAAAGLLFFVASSALAPDTQAWIVATLVVAAAVGLLGGFLARRTAGEPGPVLILAGIVIAMGLVSFVLREPIPAAQAGELAPSAPSDAHRPAWLSLALPAISAIAVVLGGGALRRPKPG